MSIQTGMFLLESKFMDRYVDAVIYIVGDTYSQLTNPFHRHIPDPITVQYVRGLYRSNENVRNS